MSAASHGPQASAVAVAVSGSGRSRRAVRWAAENLAPSADRVVLVHVIPSVTSVPSPAGKAVPVERLEQEVVDLYVEDLKSRAEQGILPFKRLCRIKNVETVVLEGESPAAALVRFLSESGTGNLVMGSSSLRWIKRILKIPDVPSVLLKSAPASCNIFVVSRHRVTMKSVNHPTTGGASVKAEIQKVSLKAFNQRELDCIFSKRTSSYGSNSHDMKHSLVPSDVNTCGGDSGAAIELPYDGLPSTNYGNLTPYGDMMTDSMKDVEAPEEVVRLRQELQDTLAVYRKACEDLVHAKKKVALLSAECSEEVTKVRGALEREEVLKLIAVEERAKHLEAVVKVNEAKELLAKEIYNRHNAENVASGVCLEKFKVLDSIFSNGRHCRRYLRMEIEAATDNFSETKKIGEGGYGKVYKCELGHTPVAVKVLHEDRCETREEFIREVEVLTQLRHPHLLLLLGGCPELGCLVYEYMENGSLDDRLFCRDGTPPLPWFIRFRIIFEVACGLAFLHGNKPEPIVHRDLKPGNILLDKNYVSKIGDVGLAKLMSDVVPDGLTEFKDTIIAGTLFYMDPEYQRTGTVRPKSDVYAFGIIMLQLLTARHPRGLVVAVGNAVRNGSFASLLDKSIRDWPIAESEKMAELALRCCRLRCRERPDLDSEVLPEIEECLKVGSANFKLMKGDAYAPRQYLCPILQEVMEDPYIAGDGYTYEYRAIKAWLGKHKISPVTKVELRHTCLVPNYTLRSAIKHWRSSLELPTL